jgi:hypothetical protein
LNSQKNGCPETVRILGYDTSIKFDQPSVNAELHKAYGIHKRSELEILIATDHHIQSQKETVIHEILHGISDAVGAKLKERQVSSLSRAFFAVLSDNPALVKWLFDEE